MTDNDISMTEREKRTVTVNCVAADGVTTFDITDATEIEWIAYDQGGNEKIRKTLGIMTITKGASGTGGITSFYFYLYPADTILPVTKTYGTAIVWNHEARVTFPATLFGTSEYVPLSGKMYIMPSITGLTV